MNVRPESADLAASIGSLSVDLVGRDNLRGLQVFIDNLNHVGTISVALYDNTDSAQKNALVELADVERAFFDDAILSFSFVRDIDHAPQSLEPSVRHFSYA